MKKLMAIRTSRKKKRRTTNRQKRTRNPIEVPRANIKGNLRTRAEIATRKNRTTIMRTEHLVEMTTTSIEGEVASPKHCRLHLCTISDGADQIILKKTIMNLIRKIPDINSRRTRADLYKPFIIPATTVRHEQLLTILNENLDRDFSYRIHRQSYNTTNTITSSRKTPSTDPLIPAQAKCTSRTQTLRSGRQEESA